MLDHVGIPVTGFSRLKIFYERALSPLSIAVVMEVTAAQTGGSVHAGFGTGGNPFFWIGEGGSPAAPVHIAFAAESRAVVDAFYREGVAAGGKGNGAPGLRLHYHPNYYGASSSIPMATTSRLSVTSRSDGPAGGSLRRNTSVPPAGFC